MLETPLIFISPRNPEELGQSLSLTNWSTVPVIMPKRGLSKKRCEQWFSQKKITPAIYSSVAGNEAMIAMVAMGCGIGVVPRLVLENSPLRNRIRVLDVRPALEPFSVGACTTRSLKRGPVVQAFWHIAEQEILNRYSSRGTDENHFDNK
jgi:LysR family positive regulator for ilvC